MYNDSPMSGQCAKQSEGILNDLNSLGCAVERLQKETEDLRIRFEPAMRPAPPANPQCQTDRPRDPASEVRSQIEGARTRILAVCEQISDMKNRADI